MGAKLGAMREDRRAVRRRPSARLAVVVLVVTGLTAGCTDSSEKPAEPSPSSTATPTPTPELNLTDVDVDVDRAAFCDALDPEVVDVVLGGEPELSDSYGVGQRVELAPGLRDVSNEHGCTFERGSLIARAWLFAQPVTSAQARALVELRNAEQSCRPAGELSFGDPGVVQSCAQDGRQRVTASGLFGDAWLTCQLLVKTPGDPDELLEQAQRWCTEVAWATAP